jgi:Ca-activated chloride channel homolog
VISSEIVSKYGEALDYFIRFANFGWIYFLLPLAALAIGYRLLYYKPIMLKYSLVTQFKIQGMQASAWKQNIFLFLQFLTISLLLLLCLQPQVVNRDSKVPIEGIDIVLSLDVSGSMECFDQVETEKTRFMTAKEEAVNFIDKRVDDQIGLVIFGAQAITLCPLTLDKNILNQFLNDLHLGFIDANGTMLGASLVSVCNRLKKSKAKTKIAILLTDGAPSPGDIPPDVGIGMARKLGIKVYTIGVGSESGGYGKSPFGMVVRNMQKINKVLLKKIADETGGKFYLAENQQDMRRVYRDIDKLERSNYETDIYSDYVDLFFPITMLILALLFFYLFFNCFVWFGV